MSGGASAKKLKSSYGRQFRYTKSRLARAVAAGSSVPKTKSQFTRAVKAIVRNDVVTLQTKLITDASAGIQTLDNVPYTLNLLSNIQQGTSLSTRLGETILLRDVDIFLRLSNRYTGSISTTEFRVIMFWLTDPASLSSDAFIPSTGGGLNLTNFSYSSITMSNASNFLVDNHEVDVVYDELVSLNESISAEQTFTTLRIKKKFNKKYTYQTGSQYGKTNFLYFVVVGNVQGATPGIDAVGFAQANAKIEFENCQ